jgi:hypothetical protein
MKSIRRLQYLNESGQGVVEYILILIVVLLIFLGGVYQLNTAFRSWADNYFGDYLTCLLETGELPAISGSGGVAGVCNEEFQAFSFTAGRPLRGDTPRGGGGRRGGSSEGGDDNRGNQGGSPTVVGAAGGGSSRLAPRGDTFQDRFRDRSGRRGSGRGSGSGSESEESDSTGGRGNAAFLQNGQRRKIIVRRAAGGLSGARRDKDEDRGEKRGRVRASAGVTKQQKNARLKVRAIANEEDPEMKDTDLGIGDWLRYLIIIAILIALFIFLGGQALQISKSMD